MFNSKLCFFSETGTLIDENNLWSNNDGYIVLATIQNDKRLIEQYDYFSLRELTVAKKYLYNQSGKSKKNIILKLLEQFTVLDMEQCIRSIQSQNIVSINLPPVSALKNPYNFF